MAVAYVGPCRMLQSQLYDINYAHNSNLVLPADREIYSAEHGAIMVPSYNSNNNKMESKTWQHEFQKVFI